MLEELSVKEFTELLGSDAPAPGGGSAAALAGAQGAALTAMVCALTLGRKKYAEFEALANEGYAAASKHRIEFLSLMQADTDAYNGFRAAMALPKETEAEKEYRRSRINAAAIESTLAPLSVMHEAAETLELTRSLLGKTNVNAVSDLGVAALSLNTALHGAWLNVKINLPGLPLTPEETGPAKLRAEAEALLARGQALAEEILQAVENALA